MIISELYVYGVCDLDNCIINGNNKFVNYVENILTYEGYLIVSKIEKGIHITYLSSRFIMVPIAPPHFIAL